MRRRADTNSGLLATAEVARSRVLLLTPQLADIGGVGNYYKALQLHHDDPRIEYFPVTAVAPESTFQFVTRLLRNYWRFWKALGTRQYGLVVLNPSLDPRAFYRDAVFCYLARLRRVGLLVFFRGWVPGFEEKIHSSFLPQTVFAATFAKVRQFVVLGKVFERKLVALGASPDSRFWIESTVADTTYVNRFAPNDRSDVSGALRLLFLARLTAAKQPLLALEAFQQAQVRRPDLKLELVIAGPGPEFERLQQRITTDRIQNVTLAGPVRDLDKAELLARSHVLLHPTASGEGMPNAVLEAMLYGMPILSTTMGAIPEIVVHGTNGFITPSPTAECFADWIILLATDVELRARMAQTNRDQAFSRYTANIVRERFKAIIDACVAK